jgi:hypothetical protein
MSKSDKWGWLALAAGVASLAIMASQDQIPTAADAAFWAPGGIYGDNWDSVKFEPFSGGRWGFGFTLILTLYFALTHLLGYRIAKPWMDSSDAPLAIKLCAGFLPGYLTVTGVNRLLTLFLPHPIGPYACLSSLILLTFAFYWPSIKTLLRAQISSRTDFLKNHWKSLLSLLGVYLFSLLLHVQGGRIFMVSDSTGNIFLPLIAKLISQAEAIRFFPVFDQQYDEFTYAYPLNFIPWGKSLPIVPFWWLASIGKVALGCGIYLVLNQPGSAPKSRWLPLTATLAIVFSGLLPNPFKFIELTACMLPVIDAWHIGRMIGVLIPFLMLGLFFRRAGPPVSIPGAALLGMGLGATSIQNSLFGVGVMGLAFFWHFVPYLRVPKPAWRVLVALTSLVCLTAVLSTYLTGPDSMYFHGKFLLVAGLLPVLCVLVRPKLPSESPEASSEANPKAKSKSKAKTADIPAVPTQGMPPSNLWSCGALLAGLMLSLCLFGNITSPNCIASVRSATPEALVPGAYRQPPVSRAASVANIHSPKLYFRFFGNRSPSQHATSAANFLAYYGLLMVGGVILALTWIKTADGPLVSGANLLHLQLLLFFAGTLCLAFFYVDFVYDAVLPWIKYRLIEVPFVGIILLFVLRAKDLASVAVQRMLSALFLFWALSGLICHKTIPQMAANFGYVTKFFSSKP